MERIKQAVEKAREARATADAMQVAAASSMPPPAPDEEHIRYSHTCSVTPDTIALRARNICIDEHAGAGIGAYKMLRTQVLQRMVAKGWNTLAITSPALGDGKSLTAINLAISLARELHHTVLLVDLDLRNPTVHTYLGITPEHGIDDFLVRGVPLSEVLLHPGIDRLVVLPVRAPIKNSSEVLASPRMGALVDELKTRYRSRFVLFDLPPVLAADDALSFAPHVDCVLLVAREGKTTRDELQHALELLKDVSVLGTVLNAAAGRVSTYY
jgi:capsular exopolysaccharide synthesis family protein